jgi:hypothetical protein
MTFAFKETEHGAFALHAYPYGDGLCTFLVETDDATWRRAGFEASGADVAPDNDALTIDYLERVFRADLGGEPLIGNHSRWLAFRTLRATNWSSGRLVLLGDAAHTAHFSLGSGTRMALEDAVALASALAEERSTAAAVARYERERRPGVERLQTFAQPSRRWWETFRIRLGLAPDQLAFNYVTRTGALGLEAVRARDRGLCEGYPASDPLATPFVAGSWSTPTRIVEISGDARATVGSIASSGAGLALFVATDGCLDTTALQAWTDRQRQAGRRTALRIAPGAQPPHLARIGGVLDYVEVAYPAGSRPRSELGEIAERLRAEIPETTLLGVAVPSNLTSIRDLDMLGRLRDSGFSVAHIQPVGGRSDAVGTLEMAERLRLVEGWVTIATLADRDLAAAAVVAGRCDLVALTIATSGC